MKKPTVRHFGEKTKSGHLVTLCAGHGKAAMFTSNWKNVTCKRCLAAKKEGKK